MPGNRTGTVRTGKAPKLHDGAINYLRGFPQTQSPSNSNGLEVFKLGSWLFQLKDIILESISQSIGFSALRFQPVPLNRSGEFRPRHKHVNLSLKGMDGEPTRKTNHPDLPRRWVCPPSDPLPSVWGVSWDANSTWAPAALGRSCRPWAKDECSWIDLLGIGSKQNNLWGLQWISKSLGNTVLLGKNNSFKPSAQTNYLLFPTCQIKNPYIDSKTRSHTNTQICRRTI